MKTRIIIFPFYDADVIVEKVERIKRLIGEENVNDDFISSQVPQLNVRCSKKQWKEIKFICDLSKCYW